MDEQLAYVWSEAVGWEIQWLNYSDRWMNNGGAYREVEGLEVLMMDRITGDGNKWLLGGKRWKTGKSKLYVWKQVDITYSLPLFKLS